MEGVEHRGWAGVVREQNQSPTGVGEVTYAPTGSAARGRGGFDLGGGADGLGDAGNEASIPSLLAGPAPSPHAVRFCHPDTVLR